MLTSLPLPDLFITLVTSGREVGRRQGLAEPELLDAAASRALLEMRELAHLPSNTVTIDATPAADNVARRIDSALARHLFRVATTHVCANIDGMTLSDSSLAKASRLHTTADVEAWAREHGIAPDDRPDR